MSRSSTWDWGAPGWARLVSAMSLAFLATLVCALLHPAPSTAQGPTAQPGFFGVNASGYEPGDFERMAAADIGVTRNVFPFQVLKHGKKKPYYWGYTDPIVERTAQNGIDLIAMIYGAPPWVSHDLNKTVLRGESKRAWRELLIALVKRYGPNGVFWQENPYVPYRPVHYWQVWNEPNSITWWGPRPRPAEYAKVLVRSAAIIKSVDPDAQVMSAGVVARPTNPNAIPGKKFLSKLFAEPGVVDAVDIMAYHPFAPSVKGVFQQLKIARRAINKRGAKDTPIWVTEIGWGSKGPQDHPLIKSKTAQDRTLRGTMETAIRQSGRLGLQRLLWYQWRDGPYDLCLWCETSGLLNSDSQPKRLLGTFRSIATR